MKDRVTSVLASLSSGLATVVAGARWWAVLLAIFVVLVMTYGTVVWLAIHSPAAGNANPTRRRILPSRRSELAATGPGRPAPAPPPLVEALAWFGPQRAPLR
jgi:hypothetical protein